MHRRNILAAAAAVLATSLVPALAQDKWPSKPINYVVPFGAGGTTDVLARLVTPKVAAALGTTFVIDNKPGAGGSMGSDFTAKAAPDGSAIGHIHLPERCANVCFGGRHRNRLFMAASHSLYALYVNTLGTIGG